MFNLYYKADLECCEAILSFIDKGNIEKSRSFQEPEYLNMREVLKRHKYPEINYIDFTIYIRNKYNLDYTLVDTYGGYRDFFINHAKEMYKLVIRDIKLKILNLD